MNVRATDLIERLDMLTADDIRTAAAAVRRTASSAADDLDWWKATTHVERLLRREHRRRLAAAAASAASRAVRQAGENADGHVDDRDLIAVARAAADAAGALVAGPLALCAIRYHLRRLGPELFADPRWREVAA